MKDKILEAFEGTRKAGSIAAAALDEVSKIIKPGIKTEQIDKLWHDIDNGTLTNKSSGTLYLALKAVKDKYPKS